MTEFQLGLLLIGALAIVGVIVFNRVRKLAESLGHHWMMRLVDLIASPGATTNFM